MVEIVGYRTVYKNLSYYCGPGPAVVCDGEGRLVVGFRWVLSWLEYGHAGHWHPATESCLTRSGDGGRLGRDRRCFWEGISVRV